MPATRWAPATSPATAPSRSIGANRFCDLSVFSFHPVKAIAMGEGGAVTTNDPELAARLKLARNHGMTRDPSNFEIPATPSTQNGDPNPWYYELVEPEFNWRANDIQCALGLSQLGKLGRFVAQATRSCGRYDTKLAGTFAAGAPGGADAHVPARLASLRRADRFRGGRHFARDADARAGCRGIGTQVHYYPVYRQPYYASTTWRARLPGADVYYAQALSLPLFASMTEDDVSFVVETLADCLVCISPEKTQRAESTQPDRSAAPIGATFVPENSPPAVFPIVRHPLLKPRARLRASRQSYCRSPSAGGAALRQPRLDGA